LKIGHPIKDVEIAFYLGWLRTDRENSAKFVFGETVLTEGSWSRQKGAHTKMAGQQ